MRIIETKIYKIEEHPNKELCFEWIRENWNDLNQHGVDEVVESVKRLSKIIGGTVDYSISQVSDRGEHITFSNYSNELLNELKEDAYPLTGFWCDYDLISGLKENNTNKVLKSLHADTEYQYSNEGLLELIKSMEYEFYEGGKVV